MGVRGAIRALLEEYVASLLSILDNSPQTLYSYPMKQLPAIGSTAIMLMLVTASFRLTPSLFTKQTTLPSTPTATSAYDQHSATYEKVLELNGKAADSVIERVRRKMAELNKRGVTGDERRKQLTEEARAAGRDMRRAFRENNQLLPSHQPVAPDAP
jgi:hypothetical protein